MAYLQQQLEALAIEFGLKITPQIQSSIAAALKFMEFSEANVQMQVQYLKILTQVRKVLAVTLAKSQPEFTAQSLRETILSPLQQSNINTIEQLERLIVDYREYLRSNLEPAQNELLSFFAYEPDGKEFKTVLKINSRWENGYFPESNLLAINKLLKKHAPDMTISSSLFENHRYLRRLELLLETMRLQQMPNITAMFALTDQDFNSMLTNTILEKSFRLTVAAIAYISVTLYLDDIRQLSFSDSAMILPPDAKASVYEIYDQARNVLEQIEYKCFVSHAEYGESLKLLNTSATQDDSDQIARAKFKQVMQQLKEISLYKKTRLDAKKVMSEVKPAAKDNQFELYVNARKNLKKRKF